MITRQRGEGSITPVGERFRARLPVDGKRKSLGIFDTVEAAEDALHSALKKRATTPGASGGVITFAVLGRRVLDAREDEGLRSVATERRRFARHLETCPFADLHPKDIGPAAVSDYFRSLLKRQAADRRSKRKLSRKTVFRILALASAIFSVAVERELCKINPCSGIVVRRREDESAHTDEDGEEVWDWLRGDEQKKVLECSAIPTWLRLMMRFAWGTGLRQGEQWNLTIKNVHFVRADGRCACGEESCLSLREHGPHVHVKKGSKLYTPKSGKVRRTALFGEGLAAAEAWLDHLPLYASSNPLGLMFPTQTGCRRQLGAPERSVRLPKGEGERGTKCGKVKLLPEALEAAGIKRNIRWHDLRHTCASSLVSGTWGRPWSLLEVCQHLGHSSVTVTERYAHLCKEGLKEAAAATPGHAGVRVTERVTGNGPGGFGAAAISSDLEEVGRAGLEPATYGLKGQTSPQQKQILSLPFDPSLTRAQEALAALLANPELLSKLVGSK